LVLARTHYNLGMIYEFDFRDNARAEAEHRKALAILEPLVRRDPTSIQPAIQLGESYSYVGGLIANRKGEEAVEWYDRAIAALDPVLQKAPTNAQARRLQSQNYRNRAASIGRLGRYAEALQDL